VIQGPAKDAVGDENGRAGVAYSEQLRADRGVKITGSTWDGREEDEGAVVERLIGTDKDSRPEVTAAEVQRTKSMIVERVVGFEKRIRRADLLRLRTAGEKAETGGEEERGSKPEDWNLKAG